MAKKKKYYVVWDGVAPGIYEDWPSTLAQVKGYPNAKYKSFKSRSEAELAFAGTYHENIDQRTKQKPSAHYHDDIVWDSIAVDAACSGNPGAMEYRGVDTKTGTQLFHQGPFPQGTNNVGEFLALVHGLALLQQEGKVQVPIYSDSRIAIGWIKAKRARTKLKKSAANRHLFDLIGRAEKWLESNSFENEIMKWNTREWGEIPADFGRK